MAALTSSAVTPTAYWLEKGLGGKEIKVRQVTVVASPSYDKTQRLLKAAGTNAPATYSGTFKTTIRGS